MQQTSHDADDDSAGFLRSFGAALPITEIGIAMIVIGGVFLSQWSVVAEIVRLFALAIIVIGGVLVTPIGGGVRGLLSPGPPPKRATREEVRSADYGDRLVLASKRFCALVHDHKPASEGDFDGLDRKFFERMTADLTAIGCTILGDLINPALAQIDSRHYLARVMLTSDGAATVFIEHVVLKGYSELARGTEIKLVGADTEFTDGSFLRTGNDVTTGLITCPPGFRKVQYPLEASASQILGRHLAELRAITHKQPVIVRSMPDVLEAARRLRGMVSAFRHEIGYVDPNEIRRIALATGKTPELAETLARQADEARQRELASRNANFLR